MVAWARKAMHALIGEGLLKHGVVFGSSYHFFNSRPATDKLDGKLCPVARELSCPATEENAMSLEAAHMPCSLQAAARDVLLLEV